MGDALAHSITEQELENAKLKKRISELEVALSPRPLFVEPLSMMTLTNSLKKHLDRTPRSRKLLNY
jgi:hypothetical protein